MNDNRGVFYGELSDLAGCKLKLATVYADLPIYELTNPSNRSIVDESSAIYRGSIHLRFIYATRVGDTSLCRRRSQ